MGVNIANYIVLGAKLKFTEELSQKFEPYEVNYWSTKEENLGFKTLCDGMNGEYIFVGEVLACTTDDENWFGNSDDTFVDVTRNHRSVLWVIENAKEKLGLELKEDQVRMYAITHHT